jgi:hypothetical protein
MRQNNLTLIKKESIFLIISSSAFPTKKIKFYAANKKLKRLYVT